LRIHAKLKCRPCYTIAFLKEANQAEKYAQQENPERIRDFLKKIGSNFRIADRTLFCDFKNVFKIAEKYHADPANAGEDSIDFTKSENWRATSGWNRNFGKPSKAFRCFFKFLINKILVRYGFP
jgi:hypothetical protein